MASNDTRVIRIGEDGSKKIIYGTMFEANVIDYNGKVYTEETLQTAINNFLQANPEYLIREQKGTPAKITSIEIQDGKALVIAEIINSPSTMILLGILKNTLIKLMFKPEVVFEEPNEEGVIESFEIKSISITTLKK